MFEDEDLVRVFETDKELEMHLNFDHIKPAHFDITEEGRSQRQQDHRDGIIRAPPNTIH